MVVVVIMVVVVVMVVGLSEITGFNYRSLFIRFVFNGRS